MNQLGLYIHIPFCVKKCDYCDFLSFGGSTQETKDQYIQSLCSELEALGSLFEGQTVTTIYIGGGTPSVLNVENFNLLMKSVYQYFSVDSSAEITLEMNPGTVVKEKVEAYVSWGVNRVSMGLQSDDDQQLKALGRIHSYDDYVNTYNLIRSAGIDNISIDVMFGLHDQTMAGWAQTLDSVISLRPEHISAYSLIIEPDTVYERRYEREELHLPDEETERQMFWLAHKRLEKAGYKHYEISNYARVGRQSRHNSSYWNLTPYIGAGLGAASYYNGVRYKNIKDMATYIKADGELTAVRQVEQLYDPATELEEAFFLGLRRLEGVDLKKIEGQYGTGLLKRYEEVISDEVKKGHLISDGHMLKLTERGIDISNQIMSRFIIDTPS